MARRARLRYTGAMPWLYSLIAFVVVLLAAGFGTGGVLRWLIHRQILDLPNQRSSHSTATPRGGGLALVAVLLPAWAVVAATGPAPIGTLWPVIAGAVLLAAVSWLDDLGRLAGLGETASAGLRLAVQLAAVGLGLAALPDGPVLQGWLPAWLDRAVAFLAWVWFVNLFNFMDGIDGIAAVESIAIALGVALVAGLAGLNGLAPLALTAAAAALGFLKWNWHPARVFMGDVGAVPLGFLLGWLLLTLAAAGQWAPALILPLYYLADATITLVRRLLRGARPWQAHREHWYQRAARRIGGHDRVVRVVAWTDAALVGLAALAALADPWPALAGAVAAVALLLARLSALAGRTA